MFAESVRDVEGGTLTPNHCTCGLPLVFVATGSAERLPVDSDVEPETIDTQQEQFNVRAPIIDVEPQLLMVAVIVE